jgi:hypothetical protein
MQLIDSIQNNLNSYTDLNPPASGAVYYQVSAVKIDTCYPANIRTGKHVGPYSQSYSNLKDYNLTEKPNFELSVNSIKIDSSYGSEGVIDVFSSLNYWEAFTNVPWINVSSDYLNKTITIRALEPNHNTFSRIAILSITGNGIPPKEVMVYQLGTEGNTSIPVVSEKMELKIFPNPANEYVFVELPEELASCHEIEIFNQFGKKVMSEPCENQKTMIINTEQLSKGVYLLRIKGERSYMGRFVKI